MKILLLDYAGHIPQADLAKKLAKVGNKVLHIRCSDYLTGNASFTVAEDISELLEFRAISAGISFNRYNPFLRISHEIQLAKRFDRAIRSFNPDYLITSNVPLLCSYLITRKLVKRNTPFIFWWQDVYSVAINTKIREITKSLPLNSLAKIISSLEKFIAESAFHVVAISDNFLPLYRKWDLPADKFTTLPNWTPPEDFDEIPHDHIEADNYVLYAGTLGMKHNPKLLSHLAFQLQLNKIDEKVIVISQGLGREYLESLNPKPTNLVLKDFVPIAELQSYLSGADIALAILEPSASEYSVPSKIMTYLAAGKAIVAAISRSNPAAQYIQSSESGLVVDPVDEEAFSSSVILLLENQELRSTMQINARQFALENFDGKKAAEIFIRLMQ